MAGPRPPPRRASDDRLSPLEIDETLRAVTGARFKAKFIRSSHLLVSVTDSDTARDITAILTIKDVPVEFSLPRHLNSSRGTILAPELADHPKETLLEGLAPLGVVDVLRRSHAKILILIFDHPQVLPCPTPHPQGGLPGVRGAARGAQPPPLHPLPAVRPSGQGMHRPHGALLQLRRRPPLRLLHQHRSKMCCVQ